MTFIPGSSNLYENLPRQEVALARELLRSFTELQITCASSLTKDPDFIDYASRAVNAALEIFVVANAIAKPAVGPHVSALDWNFAVLAARTCDRALATLGAANMQFAHGGLSYFPFTSVLHSCVQHFEVLLRELSKLPGTTTGRELYGSGQMAEIVQHGASVPSSIYEPDVQNAYGRSQIISGVVSDCLDLITDLQHAAGVPPTGGMRPSNAWMNAIHGLNPETRSGWKCGALFLIDDFANNLRTSVSDVEHMAKGRKLLSFKWWDGRDLFPGVQIDPTSGNPYPKIVDLLKALEPDSYTTLGLSMWLGLEDGHAGVSHARLLQNRDGFKHLKDKLAAIGVLAPGKYSYPTQRMPGTNEMRRALAAGYHVPLRGCGAAYVGQWSASAASHGRRTSVDYGKPMFRITRRSHGPFFFSRQPNKKGSGGRFDMDSKSRTGTVYLAETVDGAISEVYERFLVLDIQAVTTRLLWEMRNTNDIGPLLDLTDSNTGTALGGVATAAFTTMDRLSTQQLATDANNVGYRGLVHLLKTTTLSKGYALFGPAGPTYPESAGLGSWSCKVMAVSESDDFWTWVGRRASSSHDSMHIILNQLPFEKLLPN
jgi:hypothetical protein